jgi:hypothetical protein
VYAYFIASLTRWGIGLQSRDHTGLGDLVGATVLHVHGAQKEHVALLSDTRGNGLHDLAIDGLLVVGHQVLVQELLDLVRGEPWKRNRSVYYQRRHESDWGFGLHPADILNDLDIIQGGLLQLKKLGRLLLKC